MILVLLSPMMAEAVMPGIVIVKSVAFNLPMRLRLIPPLAVLVPLVVGVVVTPVWGFVVGVVLMLLFSEMLVLVGGVMPSVRLLSRLTCITTTSITTSDFALSWSSTNFCACAIWSGVACRMLSFCAVNCWML